MIHYVQWCENWILHVAKKSKTNRMLHWSDWETIQQSLISTYKLKITVNLFSLEVIGVAGFGINLKPINCSDIIYHNFSVTDISLPVDFQWNLGIYIERPLYRYIHISALVRILKHWTQIIEKYKLIGNHIHLPKLQCISCSDNDFNYKSWS